MAEIFDTHAHYNDGRFDSDRDELLVSLEDKGVSAVINCGVDIESSYECLNLSERFPFLFTAAGYHPENIPEDGFFDESALTELLQKDRIVAVGEIGLDYYWDNSRKEIQKVFFEKQLSLAEKLNMPVIIHSRDASKDTLDIVKRHKVSGVMHCFSGSVETAKEYLKLGFYLGFGGAVTFKKSKTAREVVSITPLDRILLETDCPYMAPEPMRGKRNDSSLIIYVAEKIAEIKNVSTNEVLEKTQKNAKSLFGLKFE